MGHNELLNEIAGEWSAADQPYVCLCPKSVFYNRCISADLLPLPLPLHQRTDAPTFYCPNLTPVMKLGLLCFSHYLFIKDMTRKWVLPWRWLREVCCMRRLHCLLFRQECRLQWETTTSFSCSFTPPPARPSLPAYPTTPFFYGSYNDLMQIEHSSVALFVNAERFH